MLYALFTVHDVSECWDTTLSTQYRDNLTADVRYSPCYRWPWDNVVFLDFSPTVKAATLIFISGCGSAIPSAKEGKSGFIYNLVKS